MVSMNKFLSLCLSIILCKQVSLELPSLPLLAGVVSMVVVVVVVVVVVEMGLWW